MTLDEQWFKDAKEFCLLGRVFASQRNDQKLELRFRVLRSVVERISQRRKRLVFVGAFSAGKTTVLNNLMEGAKIKLPTGLSETTAIPTVVHPSERVAMFLWADDRLVEAEEDVMNEFLNLTRDKIGPMLKMYLKSHDEVVLHVPMHREFRDLEFVDLPGLLGSHSSVLDEKAFLHALASDGVLYVVNAKQGGLTRTDREFISKVVQEGVPVLVIATHMDQVKPSERESVVTQIRKQLEEWKGVVEDEVLTTDPEASGERIGLLAPMALIAIGGFIKQLDPAKCVTRNFQKLLSDLDSALSKGDVGHTGLALRSKATVLHHTIDPSTPVWSKRSESLKGTSELILKPWEKCPGAWRIVAKSQGARADWLAHIGALSSVYDIEQYEKEIWRPIFGFALTARTEYDDFCDNIKKPPWYRVGYCGKTRTLLTVIVYSKRVLEAWKIKDFDPMRYPFNARADMLSPLTPQNLRIEDCKTIMSYGSPSWATAVKKDGAWHIIVNGNIVAGPYQDAETPTLSPSGERWASKVLLQEGGWTIAFNAVDEPKNPKLFPKTFDLVSKPWFVMGGGILFAGLKGDVVELYLID